MALVYSPDLAREIRVIRRNFPGHPPPQQRKVLGARRRGLPRAFFVELEAGGVAYFIRRMTRVHRFQQEATLVFLPAEKRLAGKKRDGSAAPLDLRGAPTGCGNELDLGHEHAARMLLAEKDRAAGEVHERRAERAGEATPFGAHQVDVRLAVDLRAAEEKVIDASLPGEVEELARAF